MVTWQLDPSITHLNHGSFGAAPREVLAYQSRLRDELESNPTRFMARRLPDLIDAARRRLAEFVGATPDGLVFVTNATTGVNTVLRSMSFPAGAEIVVTDHGYNACRNAAEAVAAQTGAVVREAQVPFPLEDPRQVVEAVADVLTPRTSIVVVDHISSPTGLVFPITELIALAGNVPVLVDGAHGPGMVPLDIESMGAAFYTGNCHKWMCAPKGAGFLWVAPELREKMTPATISHGWNEQWPGTSRFHRLFDFGGTDDPTAWLSVPAAIDVVGGALDGGWPAVMEHNHNLIVGGRQALLHALGMSAPAPPDMLGSMGAVLLPAGDDGLRETLYQEHHIEVPVFSWQSSRILRISAQLYNSLDEYERLAEALAAVLSAETQSRISE